MRRLSKTTPPDVVTRSAVAWTTAYSSSLNKPAHQRPTPWRNQAILAALKEETLGKCAYCEAVIGDVSYPHVEHLLPKHHRPDLVVEWQNLTLACAVCNQNKSDYYDATAPLLNPYKDEPSKHLSWHGPLVVGEPGSGPGRRTVDKLRLSRPELLIERARRIQQLHRLIEAWRTAEGGDRDVMQDVISDEIADDREFAQALRAYVSRFDFPVEA